MEAKDSNKLIARLLRHNVWPLALLLLALLANMLVLRHAYKLVGAVVRLVLRVVSCGLLGRRRRKVGDDRLYNPPLVHGARVLARRGASAPRDVGARFVADYVRSVPDSVAAGKELTEDEQARGARASPTPRARAGA